MECLIVEDDFAARKPLQMYLSDYGDRFIAVNGREAVDAVQQALEQGQPYDLICLDIMMPEMDGREALKRIRRMEQEHKIYGLDAVKVIMTTALDDSKHITAAFRQGCEAYIIKPVMRKKLLEEIKKLGLIN